MGDEDKRVVWVLGAGFSAGLGGPLLPSLLSRTLESDIRIRYAETRFDPLRAYPATVVRDLYDYGLSDERLRSPKSKVFEETLWPHAEAFIDYLDTAAEPPRDGRRNRRRERLEHILRRGMQLDRVFPICDLRTAARRAIAAECCAFLEDADVESESWRPFRYWARHLGGNDTIITFNYDRVLETLRDTQNEEARRNVGDVSESRLKVILPSYDLDYEALGWCRVLKLHGSVDWRKTKPQLGSETSFEEADERFALHGPEAELVIATPGPSKFREVETVGPLWSVASRALRKAHAVVFIGFRFPETDAYAKEILLQAIGLNTAAFDHKHLLRVHAVLGRPGYDSERLEALLRFAGPRSPVAPPRFPDDRPPHFQMHVHPLLGQDFLAVLRRDDLFA